MRIKIIEVQNPDRTPLIGREFEVITTKSVMGSYGVIIEYEGEQFFLPDWCYDIAPSCEEHLFLDTGLVRTWCKYCGVPGYYDKGHLIIDEPKLNFED